MESSNKVTVLNMVAESGNKRQAASVEDLTQVVKDIQNWFQQNHPAYSQLEFTFKQLELLIMKTH